MLIELTFQDLDGSTIVLEDWSFSSWPTNAEVVEARKVRMLGRKVEMPNERGEDKKARSTDHPPSSRQPSLST
jgi:hypothetical protein